MYKIHSFKATAYIGVDNNREIPFHGLVVTNRKQSARIDDLIIDAVFREPSLDKCASDVVVEKKSLICTTDDFVDPALKEDGVYLL